jgi:hypothetical protein
MSLSSSRSRLKCALSRTDDDFLARRYMQRATSGNFAVHGGEDGLILYFASFNDALEGLRLWIETSLSVGWFRDLRAGRVWASSIDGQLVAATGTNCPSPGSPRPARTLKAPRSAVENAAVLV